jgi:hypothetical protein
MLFDLNAPDSSLVRSLTTSQPCMGRVCLSLNVLHPVSVPRLLPSNKINTTRSRNNPTPRLLSPWIRLRQQSTQRVECVRLRTDTSGTSVLGNTPTTAVAAVLIHATKTLSAALLRRAAIR